jgi:hypothetical protein
MLENINGMKWKKNGIVTEIAKINSLTTEMKKKKNCTVQNEQCKP